MPLLPRARSFRSYRPGGALPGDVLPEDPEAIKRKKKLAEEQADADGMVDTLGSVASAAPQAVSALSAAGVGGLGTAASAATATTAATAGTGLAGAAGAAGPIGMAVAAGHLIGGKLRGTQLDENGFVKTGTGNKVVSSVANVLDPIGNAMNVWKRDDVGVGTKLLSTISPGASSWLTADADEAVKKKAEAEKLRRDAENNLNKNAAATRSTYGGLASAQVNRRGGLLPRGYALGGEMAPPNPVPKKPAAPAPATYSVANPSPEANQYYANVLPTLKKMTGGKYNETYLDEKGNKQQANSCLAFANSCLEVATGKKTIDDAYANSVVRPREMAYNPEFTKRSQELGWEAIGLKDAKAGDRIQYWNEAGSVSNGVDRMADVGDNNYLPGKYPSHMMVFGGWNGPVRPDGQRSGVMYNDGHEKENADREIRENINPKEFVAYRYVGVSGQPTNNPAQAVAPNPAAPKPVVASRARGGLLPGKPSQVAPQDATAPRNLYRSNPSSPAAKSNEPSSFQGAAVRAVRKALPINVAMMLQDFAGNKLPLTGKDLGNDEINALRNAARAGRAAVDYNLNLPGFNHQKQLENRNDYPISEGEYAEGFDHELVDNTRNPDKRMATTVGGATIRQRGGSNNMQLTDGYDFNRNRNGVQPSFSGKKLVTQRSPYAALRYAATYLGSEEGKGIPVKVNLGNLKRPRPNELKRGGLLPRSVIATGALHSERNQHHGHATAGKRGIPVLDTHGNKLAEVERDEWTLADHASQKLELLRNGGSLLALGTHVQQELLTNTIPSPRYKKRLLPVK